jgi:hypothetical protein
MGQGRAIAICGSNALMAAETPRQLSAVRCSQRRESGKPVMSFEAVCEEARAAALLDLSPAKSDLPEEG